MAPEVSGKVADRSAGFRTGGFIKKGDVLFQIDPADYKLAIERRKAEIAQLRADIARLRQEEKNHQADLDIAERQMELVSQEMERNKRLQRQGVISSGQYDQSQQNFLRQERTVQSIKNVLALLPVQLKQKRAALDANRSELKRATLQLSRTKIVAPFDARARETSLEIGNFASAGKSVGKIYDISALEVPVSLPVEDARWAFRRNREIPFPRSQEEVNSFFPAARVSWNRFGKKFEWTGRVSLVDSGLDESTRALTLVVEISEPMK
ncbi:MAG: biotin/lipoyl-binding protein, partial [Nitrospinae bacterium]|nr:biotin/lipoyl-binding protein [Nitrospinota bacterium]